MIYSNASCFSLLWLYLGNSQVSVYRTIGPTLVLLLFILNFCSLIGRGHVTCEPVNIDIVLNQLQLVLTSLCMSVINCAAGRKHVKDM